MVDWAAIRADYGKMSGRKLSEKHGVPRSTITDRSEKEGWTAAGPTTNPTIEVTAPEVDEFGRQLDSSGNPIPEDPLSKWSPRLGHFYNTVIDGNFACLHCGIRMESLAGPSCRGSRAAMGW